MYIACLIAQPPPSPNNLFTQHFSTVPICLCYPQSITPKSTALRKGSVAEGLECRTCDCLLD